MVCRTQHLNTLGIHCAPLVCTLMHWMQVLSLLRVQGKLRITTHLYLYSLLAVFSFISVMSAIKLSRIKYFGTLILIQIVQCPSIHHDMFSAPSRLSIWQKQYWTWMSMYTQDIVETSKEDNVSKEMRLLNCTQNFKSNYPRRIWFHRKKEEW